VEGTYSRWKAERSRCSFFTADCRQALERCLVVVGVRQVAVRPQFTAVDHLPQSAPARQTHVARELERVGDVSSADVEFDLRRRISAERDTAQRARPAVDEMDTGRRSRLVRHDVVVRYDDPLHRHWTRRSQGSFTREALRCVVLRYASKTTQHAARCRNATHPM